MMSETVLRGYEKSALENVAARARETVERAAASIRTILDNTPHKGIDIDFLENKLLTERDVTLNFHPDRYSGNGRLIIENLLDGGQYLSQFVTGVSNGGRTAFPGGDRDLWEKRMFMGAYHGEEKTYDSRPKYGSLNIHGYADGGSARFGSCFFTLQQRVLERCTFAYGDSSANPEALGVKGGFHAVFLAILRDADMTGRLLNQSGFTANKAVEYIRSMRRENAVTNRIGRNLDDCVEAHVHGDIRLGDDVDALGLDESFRATPIWGLADRLSKKYNIQVFPIPERKVHYGGIRDEFRGPGVPALAKRVIETLGVKSGYINAAVIGEASRLSAENPGEWADLGGEAELFQYFKQLWHTVAYFG